MSDLKIVDDALIGNVVRQAQASPRLLNALEPGTVIFEVEERPYIPHEIGGVLEV